MKVPALLILLGAVSFSYGDEGFSRKGNVLEHRQPQSSSTEIIASPMSTHHMHGRPVLENPHLEPQQRRYWEEYNTSSFFTVDQGNKLSLWFHAILAIVAFGLFPPATILLSIDPRAQWLYVPLQTVETGCGVMSLVCLAIYSATAPDIYPGNFYSVLSIAMFALLVTRWLLMILKAVTGYISTGQAGVYSLARSADDEMNMAYEYELEDNNAAALQESEPPRFASNSAGAETSGLVKKLAENRMFVQSNRFAGGFATMSFNTLNISVLLMGFAYLLIGLATAFCMGKGKNVYGLVAHWTKGFIFFALGFLELARFFGAGFKYGWAWNEVAVGRDEFSQISSGTKRFPLWPKFPSVEFLQSFAIFLYGSTNVFLEHLGNSDGNWSHKDLQHASIAFMFFGSGLCGIVLESNSIKKQIRLAFRLDTSDDDGACRRWSLNPMPAFTVFWTGVLMSRHEQETELSTAIHMQWGFLLSLAAVLRLCTFALLRNSSDPRPPQRPFTEVLVAFCLICGGIIFMSSNRESVEGMIYRGMDQMFTLNVSVGITVICMAYFTGCLAIKGWTVSKY